MTVAVVLDKDLLYADIFSDNAAPVEPQIQNPQWDRFQTFDFWAGATKAVGTPEAQGIQASIKAGADWRANPLLRPPANSGDVRWWDFTAAIASGDVDIVEIIDMVKEFRSRSYFYEVGGLVTYFEIDGPDNPIRTMTVKQTPIYIPQSYNTDEAGDITDQKTWRQWIGSNQTLFEIAGKFYVASFAGVSGNYPCAGSIIWLARDQGVVDAVLSTAEFQAIQPSP